MTTRRPYQSSLRAARAEENRRAALAAGRRLFARDGFVATTIDAVAREAGVSAPYVYATFEGKGGLLVALVHDAKDAVDVGGRYRALMEEPDPREALAGAVTLTRAWVEAACDVAEAVRAASASSPEALAVWTDLEGRRWRGQHRLVKKIEAALRPGLGVRRATDRLWALTAHDLYRLVVLDRGWSADAYEAWLTELVVADLLATVE